MSKSLWNLSKNELQEDAKNFITFKNILIQFILYKVAISPTCYLQFFS